MERFLSLSKSERNQLLEEATLRSPGIKAPTIMEKDFWVCWILNRIYSNSELTDNITFKGGTSLSKCYGIIDRFSEDCDLTIDKEYIGILEENDPRFAPSKKQQRKRLQGLSDLVEVAVNERIKPLLLKSLDAGLNSNFDSKEWSLVKDQEDPQTLLFHYPSSLIDDNQNEYIQSAVKLEFGARGDREPAQNTKISPYIESSIPEIFNQKINIEVNALSPVRTFWEKIMLLHAEHHRSTEKRLPLRLFRHYYDLVMLDKCGVTQEALKNAELLDRLVQNNKAYFHSGWANYDTANIGTLRLTPKQHFLPALKKDFLDMEEMFFGDVPVFEEVMDGVERIEGLVN